MGAYGGECKIRWRNKGKRRITQAQKSGATLGYYAGTFELKALQPAHVEEFGDWRLS